MLIIASQPLMLALNGEDDSEIFRGSVLGRKLYHKWLNILET
jgi:hypothetical protein